MTRRAKVVDIDADLPEVKPEPRQPKTITPASNGNRPQQRRPVSQTKAAKLLTPEEVALTEAIDQFHRQADSLHINDPLAILYRMAANQLISALRNRKSTKDLASRVKAMQAKFALLTWELGQVEESIELLSEEYEGKE
jgi:hypothetical protein